MYTPTLGLTHKMFYHILRLEEAIRQIKDTQLSSPARNDLLNRMGSENLYNIGKLIGGEVSFNDSQKIYRGKTLISNKSYEMVLSNYRSMCDFVYSAGNDKHMSLSPSLLMHLNKLIMNGLVDSWDAGRFRNVTDTIKQDYDLWYDLSRHDISGIDLQHHFFEVLTWFLDKKYYIHPIIKIACVFYELIKYYPFVSGNQITAIAAMELLFEKSKLSLGGMFPVARNLVLYEDEYQEGLKFALQKNDDLTVWVERFVRGVSLDVMSLKNEVLRLEEEKLKHKRKKLLDLNARQLKLIRYLRLKNKIKRNEYVKIMGVSTMTAFRDLNELLERKIVEVRGGGRSTFYALVKEEEQTEPENGLSRRPIVKVINDMSNIDNISTPGSFSESITE